MGIYQEAHASGKLAAVRDELRSMLTPCTLCPRRCHADRLAADTGYCGISDTCLVASHLPHHGEEPCLSGTRGSGTIFFSGCNLSCRFCQNYQISQDMTGEPVTGNHLAGMMLELQDRGCHNINLVSPSHVLPFILDALVFAAERGLRIPMVYNSNGYDSPAVLARLEGIIDIYLPDLKYAHSGSAADLSGIADYPAVSRKAVLEMHRQAGSLRIDGNGIATRGLMIRHLVLPGGLAGSRDILVFLAENGLHHIPLSIMSQYHPAYRTVQDSVMGRTVTPQEYRQVVTWADEMGFGRLLVQEMDSHQTLLPDFDDENPFNG